MTDILVALFIRTTHPQGIYIDEPESSPWRTAGHHSHTSTHGGRVWMTQIRVPARWKEGRGVHGRLLIGQRSAQVVDLLRGVRHPRNPRGRSGVQMLKGAMTQRTYTSARREVDGVRVVRR
jgi:hypothetical protein